MILYDNKIKAKSSDGNKAAAAHRFYPQEIHLPRSAYPKARNASMRRADLRIGQLPVGVARFFNIFQKGESNPCSI